jgi:hypothetical protein
VIIAVRCCSSVPTTDTEEGHGGKQAVEPGGRSEVDEGNVIAIMFGDFSEEDQRHIQEELRRERHAEGRHHQSINV